MLMWEAAPCGSALAVDRQDVKKMGAHAATGDGNGE
jgi:hypothetical protein